MEDVECPVCGEVFSPGEDDISSDGQVITCPSCGSEFDDQGTAE
jgi:ribosomal protein S27E